MLIPILNKLVENLRPKIFDFTVSTPTPTVKTARARFSTVYWGIGISIISDAFEMGMN